MATWYGNNVGISSGYARVRYETQLASQNTGGNYSTINWQAYIDYVGCDAQADGGFVESNAGVLYNQPGRVYSYVGNFSNHTVGMGSGSFNIGHDADGNGSYSGDAHVALYASGTSSTSGSAGLPRIALAPIISSLTADTIKPTSARLGVEISSVGHGTSATFHMYYRENGVGSYTDAGAQADAVGYNYWSITGLKPGKTYQYYTTCTNNNGDVTTSGIQTFKTQPVSGMISVMRGLL